MKLSVFLFTLIASLFAFNGYGQTMIYDEDFTGQDGKGATGTSSGTTTDLTGVDWSIDVGTTLETDGTTNQFEVVTNEAFSGEAFAGIDIDGSAFWFSPTIDVTSIDDVDIEVDLGIIADGANSNGENLTVYYTLNPNASNPTYTTIQSYDINNDNNLPLTLAENNIDVSSTNNFGIRIEIDVNGLGDGFSFDNIEVVGTGACTGEPTAQATDITFSNETTSSIDVSWSTGIGGDEYILVARKGANVNFTPTDGTDYFTDIASGDFTAAVNQTAGNKVVFSGSGTSATVDGLCDDTTYYFQVFHYCSNTSFDYLTATGTNNDGSQNTSTNAVGNTFYTQEFETLDDGYTASATGGSGDTDVFNRVDPNIGGNSSFIWAAEDMDGATGVSGTETLTLDEIDVTGFSDFTFSLDLLTPNSNDWDVGDEVLITYSLDGGSSQNLLWVQSNPDGNNTNAPAAIDRDFDGDGYDGEELPAISDGFNAGVGSNFENFSAPQISLSGNTTLDITIEYDGLTQNDVGLYMDNIEVSSTSAASSVDEDSSISDVTIQPSGSIASTADTFTDAVSVFEFEVTDSASGDADDTEISQFRLIPGPDNTANWQDVIQGIRIESSNSNSVLESTKSQFVSQTNDEIVIEITDNSDGEMTIASGTTVTFTIKVFLEKSGIIDNKVLQFMIPTNSTGWLTPSTGSSLFECSFTAFNGNPFTIEVDGDGLGFLSDASDTNINEAMTTVEVANTDVNGNVDRDLTDAVDITSTGTLDGGSVSVNPNDGVATFSGLTHTELGTGLTLTADATGVNNATSAVFAIRERPELMISEITDPADHGTSNKIRYVELFNASADAIDFSTENYFLHKVTSNTSVQLTGSIGPKEYYIVALNSADFNTEYGFSPDLQSGVVDFNGNDAIYLSTNDTEASLFDIYGVIADNNTSGQLWDYENTRAYRTIPATSQSNSTYTPSEWTIDASPTNASGMNPNEGEKDYIYVNDTDTWTTKGLSSNPDGNGTTTENLFVEAGTATLNTASTVNDVTVRSGATLIIEDLLTIDGDIISEGTTIFRSTATKTAALDQVPTNTRVRGSGFQTERYVPATSRSFRYLSSSVNTPGTIYDNWQEGGTSPANLGTHITGSKTGANGFDATSTGNPSLFQWNEGNQVWDTKTSTNDPATDQLIAGDAYAMLIRGDRNAPLNSNTSIGDPTTLRATGSIVTGDVEIGVDVGELADSETEFSLVGNPYQAQVDLELLLKNNNTDLSSRFAYIYDPHITDNGGYATIDLGTGVADGNTSTTPTTGTDANRFLQPNQAFFVETTATNPNPSLTFIESIKSTATTNVSTFSNTNTTSNQFISINLYDDDNQNLKDGVRVKFASDYSNQVNNADAPKLWNDFEWFSIVNNNNYMAIESRALPQQNDTINLYTGNYQSANYHFEIDVHEMDYVDVQLYDAYQDTHTDLSSGQNSIAFSVDASIPESIAGDRFQLVFDQVTLGINDQAEATSLQIYPNPVANNKLHISGLPDFSAGSEVDLQLYNMLGQKVYQESITKAKQDQEVNLPELNTGNYLLQLTSGEQKQNKHLLIK